MHIRQEGSVDGFYHNIKVIRNAGKKNQRIEEYCVNHISKNLILDGFFTHWLAGSLSQSNWRFFVGTGTVAPANGNTQLDNQIGLASNSASVTQNSTVLDGADYIASCTAIAQWNVGAIVGNISEIGLNMSPSTSGADLDSRALIVDSVGTPTTISVTADDQLVASYTLRYKIPITQHVSNFTFKGASTTCTLETLNINDAQSWGLPAVFSSSAPFDASNPRISASASLQNDITANPNGVGTLSGATLSYSSVGSLRRVTISASSSQLNISGGIKYLLVMEDSIRCRQGILFDPPLDKTTLDTMELYFDYGLTRA